MPWSGSAAHVCFSVLTGVAAKLAQPPDCRAIPIIPIPGLGSPRDPLVLALPFMIRSYHPLLEAV